MNVPRRLLPVLGSILLCAAGSAGAQSVVYRCPGNNFTNALTPKQAEQKGCKAIEGGNVTVVGTTPAARSKPVASAAPSGSPAASGGERNTDRVSSQEQKARDSDARRILENELRTEQERLSVLLKDYNNGEPERRGDERNYQKYQERVAEMKAAVSRKEADIAAIKRELNKLPQ